MNRRVWWVLRDYVGRTLGLWLLVLLAQFIQSVTFWAAGIPAYPFARRSDRQPGLQGARREAQQCVANTAPD